MAHDHNGRVGPPRCEECNAPLNSDERRSVSELSRSLCVDCHCALYPFPIVKKKRRRLIALRAGSSASSPFEIALPLEIEPLRRA
jgi:predicted CXXCH cytochrome family protein